MTKSTGVGRGGRREGSGAKKRPPVLLSVPMPKPIKTPAPKVEAKQVEVVEPVKPLEIPAHEDPKVFLAALMNQEEADIKLRIEAARALLPYTHHKLGEGGKKEEKAKAAKQVGAGKFGASAPPKLIVNNR